MHLCYLCDEYPPGPHGGIGSLTQTLARAMTQRGHQVTVVGIYRVPREQVDYDGRVKVIRLPHAPLPWTGIIVNGLRLRRAIRRIDAESPIDVIEGPELSLAMLPRRQPIVRVIRMSGGHHFFAVTLGKSPRAWRSWLEHRSFARADHLCAVSDFVGRTTRDLLRLGDRPIEVLPNPVDVSRFHPSPAPAEPGLIVFLGTLTPKKGVRELVQAFPTIRQAVPEARLILAGRDTRDPHTARPFSDALRAQLRRDDAASVEFTGHLDRPAVAALLTRASVAVFPSHMESQGLVILEALASGLAVVTSETGPGPEIVEDGVSGLLCNPHDPASIARAIVRVLQDDALRARLGRAGRMRAVEGFSEEALMDRTQAFYARCVGAPVRRSAVAVEA